MKALRESGTSGPNGHGPALSLSNCEVFLDFDNTVTRFDVLDRIIRRFAVNRDWVALEDDWQVGKIGSKACLEGQLRSVRVTKAALARYLASVPVDPHFITLITWLKSRGIRPIILSDNFSFIVSSILRRHNAGGLRVYANRIRFVDGRLVPSFPYQDRRCARGCGHCKKPHLTASAARGKRIIYVGDGLSDRCPAEEADLVFAKSDLRRQLRKAGRRHVAFRDLGDVYDCLKGMAR